MTLSLFLPGKKRSIRIAVPGRVWMLWMYGCRGLHIIRAVPRLASRCWGSVGWKLEV